MENHENFYRKQGFRFIAGVDEVGRGPLAGPVLAAAVIMPCPVPGELRALIRDSKRLSPGQRERLYGPIRRMAMAFAFGAVDAAVIDEINILEATKLAMIKALRKLSRKCPPDFILIDGNFGLDLPAKQKSIVRGDASSISIAAASIVAKVFRDRLMVRYHRKYPQYNFIQNKGYGTGEHMALIRKFGVSPVHRRSFRRVREYVF